MVEQDEEQGEQELTRWAWVEIDTQALRHNVKEAKRLIGPRCQLMAVVKADAYGHGAVETARVVLDEGAKRLAVATVDEGIELRRAGITAPILILAEPPVSTVKLLVDYNLTPTVDTTEFAIALGDAADAQGKVADYHLGINTGMNRIGILPSQIIEFLRAIDFHRGIHLEGVFTHYATADEPDEWDFRQQLERFQGSVQAIREAGFDPGIVHSANSAAIIRYPEAHFDMARLGISLYGLHPSSMTWGMADLQPVMSVKARATFVKTPMVGEGVSYGLHYRTPGGRQIVTLPLGYADGMRRELSGRCQVLIGGKRCNQVGNICMDQMMVEVVPSASLLNPVDPAEYGDEAVIVGRQGDEQITLDELADKLGTITHEVAIGFGHRMRRIYV